MTKEELIDFIGTMNMQDEISSEAYEKIVSQVRETVITDDCVSRMEVLRIVGNFWLNKDIDNKVFSRITDCFKNMPPVTPTHGTCKDCKNSYTDEDGLIYCCNMYELARFYPKEDFYCKDFEKLDKVEQIVNKSYTEDEFYNVVQDIKEVLEQE